jgi:hypothetical protein
MAWKHLRSSMKKEFKTQSSTGKVMLTVFWDLKGPILEDYLEKGCTALCSSLVHTLLAEQPRLHCHSGKETDAMRVKFQSRDHSSINSKHACVEGSVTNLKMC